MEAEEEHHPADANSMRFGCERTETKLVPATVPLVRPAEVPDECKNN